MNSINKNILKFKSILQCNVTTNYRSSFSSTTRGPWYELSEDQRNIVDMTEKFAREEIIPKAAHHDRTGEFPMEIFKKAWELGFVTQTIPTKYGGLGLSLLDQCLVGEKLAYGCAGISAAIANSGLAHAPLVLFGTDEQKREYLGRCSTGPVIASYAATEPGAGSDVGGIQTKAVQNSDGDWLLNGQKMWITNAGYANWFFVLARTNPNLIAKKSEAFTGFIVERDSPGLTVGKKEWMMGQRCSDTRGITFENVLVPKKNVLAAEGKGFQIAMGAFDLTRAPVGCYAVGLAQRAMDEATAYALQRKTFGIPIAGHQAIQFMLADMAIGIETARMAYQRAAWEQTQGRRNTYWASISKCYAADMVNRVTADAVQIFGGAGYNAEYPVEKLMRDAKVLQIYEGTAQIQRVIIAREHFDRFQGKV